MSAALFLALSCTATDPADAMTALTLPEALNAAESTYGVPQDLLATIAWAETRFSPHLGELELHHGGHPEARFGVMGLAGRDHRSFGPTLEDAADCLDRAPTVVMHDVGLNVLGAACLMAAQAEELTEGALLREADWAEVVGWYSGSDDGSGQLSYIRQVYRMLEQGFSAQTPDGWVHVQSREVDLPVLDLEFRASGDSPLISNFVYAHSSNYSNRSRSSSDIDMIVVHTAQGSYSSVYNWFANSSANASAHYVIRSSDGEITQMVWEEDRAWHAGHSYTNTRSIGIEQEGWIEQPDTWYTETMYDSLARLIVDISDRQGVPLDRDHIIGHNEAPGCSYSGGGGASCHTDPGNGFDWDRLMAKVQSYAGNNSGGGNTGGNNNGGAANGGDLMGFVKASDIYTGAPIGGATITLNTGESTTSDGSGFYLFEDLAEGTYTLQVSASGYATATTSDWVAANATNWESVSLTPSGSGGNSGGTAGYSPTGGQTVQGPSVTMDWPDTGAYTYEVKLYVQEGSDWTYYYTWSTSSSSKTAWPVIDDSTYAWTVRADGGQWSDWQTFYFAN